MRRWILEETELTVATEIIQDRLIFGANNLHPLLDLQGRLVYVLSAMYKLVGQWKREFDSAAEAAKIDVAALERRASKSLKANKDSSPGDVAGEERCTAIKDWPAQDNVKKSITLTVGEVVYKTGERGLWATVRREKDEKVGVVPLKRLRLAPLPPSDAESEEEPAPEVSEDDDDEQESLDEMYAASSEPASDEEARDAEKE